MPRGFGSYLAHKKWSVHDVIEPFLVLIPAYAGYRIVSELVFEGTVTFKLTPFGVVLFFVWLPLLVLVIKRWMR
ncbi:hypothetical protein HY641_03305 [Candidatus Woesearchaeota archaeon]|nr:hypothetical protein [Candidatus Woesearchaeota archaeon]